MSGQATELPAAAEGPAAAPPRARPAFADAATHSLVAQFLAYEARLLDEDRLVEWLDLADDAFVYEVPIRADRERKQGGNRFIAGSYRMRDSKGALRARIDRLLTGHGWVEELPSRTCRLIGAVAVTHTDDPRVLRASSSVVIYRQRGDQRDHEIIPAHHDDRLAIGEDGALSLLQRTVLLAEKCLSTNNLAIIV